MSDFQHTDTRPGYGRDGEPKSTQSVPPNSSFLLLDSNSRDTKTNPNPADFLANLSNSAQGVRRLIHRNLQWTTPIYTHNKKDWELIISFSTDNFVQKYVCYMTPFYTFSKFAGPEEDLIEYAPPNIRYYCAMVTAALSTGLRKVETPLIVEEPEAGTRLECRYSRYHGLLLSLTQRDAPSPEDYFRIENCSWLQFGHNIHGFGAQIELSSGEFKFIMEPAIYAVGTNVYFSSATPIGVYTRFISVVSQEICRNRKITSFSNLRRGGKMNATETTILPVLFENLNTLKNYETALDPTVVNLRPGDNLQHLRISILDEFGDILESGNTPGNPLQNYLFWLATNPAIADKTPYNLTDIFFDPINGPINPVYSNDLISTVLADTYGFFKKTNYDVARIDTGTPIVHYCEMIMF